MATLTLSGAVLLKMGTNANTTIKTDANQEIETFINEAEGYVCSQSKKNWIDIFATLNTDIKYVLEEATSNLAAIYSISYDMSGYTSRAEAELMIKVLYKRANDCIKLLSDQDKVTYISGA